MTIYNIYNNKYHHPSWKNASTLHTFIIYPAQTS